MIQTLNEFEKKYHNILCSASIIINSINILILAIQIHKMKTK